MSVVPSRLQLYLHTVRYLRPVQIIGRLRFRLSRPRSVDRSPLPFRTAAACWTPGPARLVSMIGPTRFRLLNREGDAAARDDWNDSRHDKLWLYNLHYFDDLNAAGSPERSAWHGPLAARWIAENPVGRGNGWEPYPLSLRIVNWVKWALRGNGPTPEWAASLAAQARYLRRRLEYHLLGNHLLANAKALVFAGACFSGDEASEWLAKGRAILRREVPEQVLRDGGHFERSPMYHAIVLEDLLDLVNLSAVYPGLLPDEAVASWRESATRMLRWLAAMTHPDGRIAFFNDAAFGVAAEHGELLSYAGRLGTPAPEGAAEGLIELPESGYIRLASGPAVALLDAAPVGPDYLPGHAHADTLSFELSLFGQRVVVNGGTSCYGAGAGRLRERGTAAHSTVQIDGDDSSEVWDAFRVARRARPQDLVVSRSDGELVVSCGHDGYRRLSGRPVHRRRWRLRKERLVVEDHVEGGFREAVARFHLHPDVAAEGRGGRGALLLRGGRRVSWAVSGGEARLVPSEWHPEFGLSVPTRCLAVTVAGARCALKLSWE